MEKIFAIKLSNRIVIGYGNNENYQIVKDKNNNSFFDSLVKMDDNEIIDVSIIMKNIIDRNFGEIISNYINLTCIDEIYKIEFLKTKKIYLLDEILIKLFDKLKLIIRDSINMSLEQAIIIVNNLSNELQFIIHRAALLSNIKIINFLDLNKSIRNYLYFNQSAQKCSAVIIKIDKCIEISIYEERKKIFSQIIDKKDINFKFLNLKEGIKEIKNEDDEFINVRDYVDELTLNAYGKKEELDKFYVYKNNSENKNLSKICIFGALFSTKFPISKESIIIFNFIDFQEKYFKKLFIFNREYEIKQSKLKIFIDDEDISYENCYYKNIKFLLSDHENNYNDYLFTIYYNQENIYNSGKDIIYFL